MVNKAERVTNDASINTIAWDTWNIVWDLSDPIPKIGSAGRSG